ncbi:hypothetical protein FA13DRAFT_1263925 [Coprinellus micaceus]|uniref:Uncharacterized protein n=1 Tax=Coprinellus micaceus TaxID=71717 RepID=A0A4Y7R932_COPMI|nr:hypothetical protein FA13DRAFT_1263925 [Coprinellus micaceus]
MKWMNRRSQSKSQLRGEVFRINGEKEPQANAPQFSTTRPSFYPVGRRGTDVVVYGAAGKQRCRSSGSEIGIAFRMERKDHTLGGTSNKSGRQNESTQSKMIYRKTKPLCSKRTTHKESYGKRGKRTKLTNGRNRHNGRGVEERGKRDHSVKPEVDAWTGTLREYEAVERKHTEFCIPFPLRHHPARNLQLRP